MDVLESRRRLADAVLRTAETVNLDGPLLDLFTQDQIPTVDDAIAATDPPADPEGTVLFPTVQGQNGVGSHPPDYGVIGHAFRTRGYEVVYPLCDGHLDACFSKPHEGVQHISCATCNHIGCRTLDRFGFDAVPFDDLLPEGYAPPSTPAVDQPREVSYEYKGVDVVDYALSSTRRSLLKRLVDWEDGRERRVFEQFLETAMILVDVFDGLLDAREVDVAFGSDPTYVYGGVPLAVAREHGVPTYSMMGGYNEGAMIAGRVDEETPLPHFSPEDRLAAALDDPLSDRQSDRVEELMDGRFEGTTSTSASYVSHAAESVDTGDYGTVAGIFTNLMWDASLDAGDVVFDDPFAWIESTVEWARGRDDTLFVLKSHPAEAAFGTNQPVPEWVREHCTVPENVRLLPADTDVNPYRLVTELDLGIVYNSTLGMEMTYAGVPTLVAGATHYRELGFTFDPDAESEYRDYLANREDLEVTDEMRSLLYRYVHFLFVRRQIPYTRYLGADEEQPVSHADLKPGNEVYDVLIERMLAGEEVVFPEDLGVRSLRDLGAIQG